MIATDENALICDFAETYHIFDYRALPCKQAATLAAGLKDDSRIKMKMREEPAPRSVLLLAAIADYLGCLIAGMGGQKRPPVSFLQKLFNGYEVEEGRDMKTFASGEDYEAERAKLLGGSNG